MSGRSSRYPFTASQWQELEHQALIFKYMASGTPIPHDLILPIRRSFYLDSSSTPSPTTQLFPHQPSIGWGCFQMGFGRKPEDPEPGRCRRTDGKKWRCSKEAYPDSKYCERHMHRGKNRSRKPVEISIATNSAAAAAVPHNPSSLIPPQLSVGGGAAEGGHHHLVYPFSASRHAGVSAPLHGGAHHHFHVDAASSTERDYRYCQGMKEDVDQYAFFSEAEREGPWRFTPLGMSSLQGETRQRGFPSHQQGGGGGGGGYFGELVKEEERRQEEKRQHCFVLGADFKLERPAKEERDEGEAQRPLRHLFDDWPMKANEPWMGSEEEEQQQPGWRGFPMTQLSISIPMAHHDFPAAARRGTNPYILRPPPH